MPRNLKHLYEDMGEDEFMENEHLLREKESGRFDDDEAPKYKPPVASTPFKPKPKGDRSRTIKIEKVEKRS
jgi:hypothetical protein